MTYNAEKEKLEKVLKKKDTKKRKRHRSDSNSDSE